MNTMPQPDRYSINNILFATRSSTDHTMPPMGCHSHIINSKERLDNKTKLLLSSSFGIRRVHQLLKAGLAMMLCCKGNNNKRAALIRRALINETCDSLSIVFGTARLPIKP